MRELPLTKDLIAALEDAGVDPTNPEPEVVVVIASYLDLLAKEYGLSESLALDTDPIERTQQPGPVMGVVRHYLASNADDLDADSVRFRLYNVVVDLAGDASARKILNRNTPLIESRFLHLAQIYWNLEATDARPSLPIKPAGDRDIPVPGFPRDFATMRWTARANQQGSYKSSGQGFRTQGARLVVLAARSIVESSCPIASSAKGLLEVRETSDPEAPLELALVDLSHRATSEGRHQEAFDLATMYLSMTQRRAVAAPFDSEGDVATAHLLKGLKGLTLRTSRRANDPVDLSDLQSAVASFATLVELEPENVEYLFKLTASHCVLAQAQKDAGLVGGAAESVRQAWALTERVAPGLERNLAQILVYEVSSSLGGDEATQQALRAADALEDLSSENWTADSQAPGLSQAMNDLRSVVGQTLIAAGHHERGIALISAAVDVAHEREAFDLLAQLAASCVLAEHHEEAAVALVRALELAESEDVRRHARAHGTSLVFPISLYFDQLDLAAQVRAIDTLESMLDDPESAPDTFVVFVLVTSLMRLLEQNLITYGWDRPEKYQAEVAEMLEVEYEVEERAEKWAEMTEAHAAGLTEANFEAEKYVLDAGNRNEALAWARRLLVVATRVTSSGIEFGEYEEQYRLVGQACRQLSHRLAEFADEEALGTARQLRAALNSSDDED